MNDKHQDLCFLHHKISCCAHIKQKIERMLFLLSSMHNVETVEDKDTKRRPEAILFYNETKRGVTQLMKCSGAIQLKQRQGDGL